MEAGKLRHRVRIEYPVNTQDTTTGANIIEWETLGTVWAAIEPLSVREFIESQTNQSEIVARIIIRYRNDVNATMRLIHGTTIYNPAGFLPDKNSNLEYLTIPCSQGVNGG